MSALTRRQVISGAAAVAAAAAPPAARPNIILVMADDQGWGDTGYNGHPVLQTPNLDAMARSGLRFDRFYSGAPVCSPTRGSCLTGRHPFRYGIFFANAGGPGDASDYALEDREATIAEILRPLGYRTGHFGKWHLGDFEGPKKASPADAGFDEWFSTVRKVPTVDPSPAEYWENGKPVTVKLAGDDSEIIMDRALRFVDGAVRAARPFLAVIWFHSPHLPVFATPEYLARYTGHAEARRRYWGAITALDAQVGRLRTELRLLGAADNTMLWYASDNGPEGDSESEFFPGAAGGLRGRKTSLFEGGIRVPGLLEWPAVIRAPRRVRSVCSTSDYLPTVLDALGVKPDVLRPLDGVSLLPLIRGGNDPRGKALAFETSRVTRGSPRLALLEGRWKLLTNLNADPDMLFDIESDESETRNLAAEQPETVRRMRAALTDWRRSCDNSRNGIEEVTYRIHPREAVELKMNVAVPAGAGPHPAILCLHGGGWSMGSRHSFSKMIAEFAAHGFLAASAQYRLAPAFRYPVQLEDVAAAIRFLRKHARTKEIALLGASAGAHLALLAAFSGKERVRAVIDISGPTDLRDWRMTESAERSLRQATGKTSDALVEDLLGVAGRSHPSVTAASPVARVRPGLPPVLIFQWKEDQAVSADQAHRLVGALARAGVTHEAIWFEGRGHALNGPGAGRIVPETVRFLRGL